MTQRERDVLDKIIDILKIYLNPGKIILFGSRAKQKFCRNSDFDLAVDKKKIDIRLKRKITEEIDKAAGLYKVDIVFLNSIDEPFKNIILKSGIVVYARKG